VLYLNVVAALLGGPLFASGFSPEGRGLSPARLGARLERTALYGLNHGDLLPGRVRFITIRRDTTPRDHRPRASMRLYLEAARYLAAKFSYFSST